MRGWLLLGLGAIVGCAPVAPGSPVSIDPASDTCAECRMLVSDVRLAAQIVAPGEEPRLFDGIACLRRHLKAHPAAADRTIYVIDHLSGDWLGAAAATYTLASSNESAMGAVILAHRNAATRDADPLARGGRAIEAAAILTVSSAAGEVR
jgi:copper chaperone NosL